MGNSVEQHHLAVGAVYVFDRQKPCSLISAQPQASVRRLEWVDALALEALSEGVAEVACGQERIELEIAIPTRLEIELVDVAKPTGLKVDELFQVQARLYDRRDRELEVGKLTNFEWDVSDSLEVVNDRSSGEFGFCDNCYGVSGFHVLRSGKGLIEASIGGLRGQLHIEVTP